MSISSAEPCGSDQTRALASLQTESQDWDSPETLARFFELSLDLFCVANTDGRLLRVNPNCVLAMGYSEAQLLERPYLDLVHPEDRESTQAAVATMAAGSPVIRFRNRFCKADGSYLHLEWNARTAPGSGVIFAVGRDISEEDQHCLELRSRDERELSILENTPAVVYLKRVDGKYLYINERYSSVFQLTPEEILGKTDYDLFPLAVADKFRQNDREVLETRNKITLKEVAPHPDGLHTYVSVKFPLFDSHGQVTAIAGISTDITEDLKREEIQHQLQLAGSFQRKLYPSKAPSIAGLSIAGAAIPARQLCGDYYDFIELDLEKLVIAVGDVSGHGLGPALAMVELRSQLRALLRSRTQENLSDIMRRLNGLLKDDLPDAAFVTLFLAEIDVPAGKIQYAGAGHQAAIIRADGTSEVLHSTGSVLGLLNSFVVPVTTALPFGLGDLFFVCTDGVTEAQNRSKELFGLTRTMEFVREQRDVAVPQIIQKLFSQVIEYANHPQLTDDMTAVVARRV